MEHRQIQGRCLGCLGTPPPSDFQSIINVLISFIAMSTVAHVMKCLSTILSCFSQLSAKRREIGIDDELGSISPTSCAKKQESVAGCNCVTEDPGATNKTLSPQVSLSIDSGTNSLEHMHLLSDSDQMPNPCVLPLETCCSAAGLSSQTAMTRQAALSLNDFNPPYDSGDRYKFANQLSELEQ